uniref:Bm1472 n=1 Tax=Brugia malayi TaxID=6279 RepID=A0A0J9Y0V5_BRUMA|nr:Bm1472 [Brugia malayi]
MCGNSSMGKCAGNQPTDVNVARKRTDKFFHQKIHFTIFTLIN